MPRGPRSAILSLERAVAMTWRPVVVSMVFGELVRAHLYLWIGTREPAHGLCHLDYSCTNISIVLVNTMESGACLTQ
jgi:hypothetical protein